MTTPVAVICAGAQAADQAEIDQHRPLAGLVQEHVAGLDVAMDQLPGVGRFQAGQALLDDRQCLLQGQPRLAGKELGQRLALDELHGKEVVPGVLADEVDGNHVGMGQLGHRRGLGVETADEILVAGQDRGQDLDGHIAVERGVVALVDIAHSTTADPLDDLKMPQSLERKFLKGRASAGAATAEPCGGVSARKSTLLPRAGVSRTEGGDSSAHCGSNSSRASIRPSQSESGGAGPSPRQRSNTARARGGTFALTLVL